APDGTRVRERGGRFELLKGLDPLKDQSYFLHRLTQAQLARTLFPVGELAKTEVRRIADEIGLPNARKKDSTGICFIGERPFREFLNRYLAHTPGPIRDDRGRTLGEHVGLSFYTLGQRKGIGIGGVKERGAPRGAGDHAPWFVARKDMAANTLYVVQGHDHPWLQSTTLTAADASWIAGAPPNAGRYAAKTRYRQADAPCALARADANVDTDTRERDAARFTLRFEHAQWAVTPGQSAVLYDGAVCLGGGVIESALSAP
ncbi:MAG: tRNA 2-thiouridine(34) synthase MnmA, partial [Rhizobacter sp.]|nr:tRNA 2-thiouridine(34) synthase MnmA [Rhizobacter sp.]